GRSMRSKSDHAWRMVDAGHHLEQLGVEMWRTPWPSRGHIDLSRIGFSINEARALQQAGRDRHRGAAHAKHLAEKFLHQRDRVASTQSWVCSNQRQSLA